MTSFEEDVFQQPEALEKTLDFYINQSDLLQQARESFHINGLNHIILTGMGSSLCSCYVAQNFVAKRGYEINVRETSELLYSQFPSKFSPKSLLIIVSQSGESGEIVKLLEKIQRMRDSPVIWAITNNENSTLGQNASLIFKTLAGEESPVSSKTFITTFLVQFLLSSALVAPILDLQALQTVVLPIIKKVRAVLTESKGQAQKIVNHLGSNFPHLYFIARGNSLVTARQSALIFHEICRVPSQAMSGGQFRHGPIEVIDQNFRAILLNSSRETAPLIDDLAESISKKWGGGKSVVITNSTPPASEDPNILYIPQPITHEYLAPIGEIIPIQYFMIAQAKARGIRQPGEFRYSKKITTEA